MNRISKFAAAAVIAALLPLAAQAHRLWIMPSGTALSGKNPWVTFDAAVSSEVFYFDAAPLRLADVPMPQGMPAMAGAPLRITAPDGTEAKAENAAAGRLRTVFDLQLTQNGTYKIAAASDGAFASYKDANGQTKRLRGTAESLAKDIPTGATDVQITQTFARVETFVTLGKPTDTVFKTVGSGVELVPVTHPNNLFAGEKATFKILLDGKPASNIEVEVVPGGNRYRFKLGDQVLHTAADGTVAVTFPEAGMYWFGAEVEDQNATIKGAKRRATYAATLEVLN